MQPKTSIAIKICGITQINQAKAIANLEIQALGVIGVKASPRYVEESHRRKLFLEIAKNNPEIERVWVVANLQETHYTKALKVKFPNIKWWKALRIKNKEDILAANQYAEFVDCLLLDAWSPKELGGSGNRINLKWLKDIDLDIPWWLAGGISSEWIPSILNEVKPFGIDASSKLETKPGIKDMKRVESLIKKIKLN